MEEEVGLMEVQESRRHFLVGSAALAGTIAFTGCGAVAAIGAESITSSVASSFVLDLLANIGGAVIGGTIAEIINNHDSADDGRAQESVDWLNEYGFTSLGVVRPHRTPLDNMYVYGQNPDAGHNGCVAVIPPDPAIAVAYLEAPALMALSRLSTKVLEKNPNLGAERLERLIVPRYQSLGNLYSWDESGYQAFDTVDGSIVVNYEVDSKNELGKGTTRLFSDDDSPEIVDNWKVKI